MKEVYDPLSQAQKHIMLKNGILECQLGNFRQSFCVCSHPASDHLEFIDCCLSKERCICERFLDIESKVMMSPQRQKLPKKEEQKQKDIENNQLLNNYIQKLAKM